ncbi:deoxyribodipyrimidine photo-lyase [Buchnera aphidicola]|uniref:deoxyribodipyrimidine photo-lyase n=1 Tax=Buchnera aphidicola TaxID=9 RepID=UPI003464C0AA
MKKNLIWFRNDLRVHDNTALYKACTFSTEQIIALFIATPQQWYNRNISEKKISFLNQNLISLKNELYNLNILLYYYESTTFKKSVNDLVVFCQQHKINNVFYNYQYDSDEHVRDVVATKKLSEQGVITHGFHDHILVSSQDILTQKNMPYKKFFSFKKKIINILKKKIPICFPVPKKRAHPLSFHSIDLNIKNYKSNFDLNLFPIGERKAIIRLKAFLKKKLSDYALKRNFPILNHTSMLSPYLSIGVLSSRYCFKMIFQIHKNIFNTISTCSWINEIMWREFYYHLLIGYPLLNQCQSLTPWEKNIPWKNNTNYFHAWKQGQTGFPIIDAGMRQLKKIGWMHNRLRMITSSFLVKNLLIDWRKGEKYFISQLIDGDKAINNGSWQWAASIGADSTPYIRIFNPIRQSKIFDSSGSFIKKFIPELNNVPCAYIHNPYEWANIKNITLQYPKPIVNFSDTKKKALLIFNQTRLKYLDKENKN